MRARDVAKITIFRSVALRTYRSQLRSRAASGSECALSGNARHIYINNCSREITQSAPPSLWSQNRVVTTARGAQQTFCMCCGACHLPSTIQYARQAAKVDRYKWWRVKLSRADCDSARARKIVPHRTYAIITKYTLLENAADAARQYVYLSASGFRLYTLKTVRWLCTAWSWSRILWDSV